MVDRRKDIEDYSKIPTSSGVRISRWRAAKKREQQRLKNKGPDGYYARKRGLSQIDLEELQNNPILAASFVLNIDLPPHEQVSIEDMWFRKFYMESSGRDVAKTFRIAVVSALRAVLFVDKVEGYISHTFHGAKLIFKYIDDWYDTVSKFRDCIRGKPNHAADAWICRFKTRSEIRCVPPDIAKSSLRLRSERWNDGYIDEWVHFPEQLVIDRVMNVICTRANKEYFLTRDKKLQNHISYLSSPDFKFNPAYKRVQYFLKKIKEGDEDFALHRYNYLDIPPNWEWIIDKKVFEMARETAPAVIFRIEWMGRWEDNSEGYYLASEIRKIRKTFIDIKLEGDADKEYILGIDVARSPAGKGDDFTISVFEVGKIPIFISQVRCNNIRLDEMAGRVFGILENFKVSLIMMDPGGGGIFLADQLAKKEQILTVQGAKVRKTVTPIVQMGSDGEGQAILCMFSSGTKILKQIFQKIKGDDELINRAHSFLKSAFEKERVVSPLELKEFEIGKRYKELVPVEEKEIKEKYKILLAIDETFRELIAVETLKDKEGNPKRTANGFFSFVSRQRKDSAYSFLYGHFGCHIWEELKRIEMQDNRVSTVEATWAMDEETISYEEIP